MTASQEEMNLQEPEGKTEPIPPEVHTGDVEQNRIDLVDVGFEHAFSLSLLETRDRKAPTTLLQAFSRPTHFSVAAV